MKKFATVNLTSMQLEEVVNLKWEKLLPSGIVNRNSLMIVQCALCKS